MGPEIPTRHLAEAVRQLELCAGAGIPVTEAVRIIASEAPSRDLQRLLVSVANDLESGESLSGALHRRAAQVPNYLVGVIAAAEASGSFGQALGAVARQLEREAASQAAMRRAATYPLVVMIFALITVGVLTLYVVPQLVPLFEELGAEIPLVTRLLVSISRLAGDLWWVSVAGLGIAGLSGAVLRSSAVRPWRRGLVVHLPLVGPVLSAAGLERFCRVLALCLRAGVPPAEAMWITAGSTGIDHHRRRLDQARDEMWRGGGFTAPLVATGLFPAPVQLMMRVGEETGSLAAQLEMAGEYFGRRVEQRLARLTAIIEPAMIVIVGVIVGTVALGLVSAVYGVLGGLEGL